ncbi:uncharacterized protein LOC105353631 [Oryzias latipes]|uniref:uncharacterized protein LOC105353631 n=1 Tax=Oryzias latipes TaxID=8090 RepID=UPI000CE20DA8|nr:uncharacterized protein LOC105353631 [Oryzias latipes]
MNATADQPIVAGWWDPLIRSVKRCGCLPRTSLCSPLPGKPLIVPCARLLSPLRPPVSLTALRLSRSPRFWTFAAVAVASSIWWTGKGTGLRNARGSPVLSSSTLPSSLPSSVPTRIGVRDRLEAVVDGGVLSWCLPVSSPFQPCSAPDSSCDQSTHQLTCFLRRPNSKSLRQFVNPDGFVMPRLSPGTYTTLSCSYLPDADALRPQHALVPATLVLQPRHSQELQQHPSKTFSHTTLKISSSAAAAPLSAKATARSGFSTTLKATPSSLDLATLLQAFAIFSDIKLHLSTYLSPRTGFQHLGPSRVLTMTRIL